MKKYIDNIQGGFSVNFAVLGLILLSLVGMAVDVTRVYSGQEKLQEIVDISAMAALSTEGSMSEREDVFKTYAKQMTSESPLFISDPDFVKVKLTEKTKTIQIDAQVDAKMDLVLIPSFLKNLTVTAKNISVRDNAQIEVVLALDVSTSMTGKRIETAKEAATDFVEVLMRENSYSDRIAISLIPFGGTIRVPANLATLKTKPSMAKPGDAPEIHDDKLMSPHWVGKSWNQCFYLEPEQVRSGLSPQDHYPRLEDFWQWNIQNTWCGPSGNEFVPLTRDTASLVNKIRNLNLSDGTGTDQAMAWAKANLSPKWKSTLKNGPGVGPYPHSQVRKIVVVMSDGKATGQHKLLKKFRKGSPPYKTNEVYRYDDRKGRENFLAVCEALKKEGITVYSIGFMMRLPIELETARKCASSDREFYVANQSTLKSVFSDIASHLTTQRIKS